MVTSDTDNITVLLYHLNNAWVGKSVRDLKKDVLYHLSSNMNCTLCTEFSYCLVEGLTTVFPPPIAGLAVTLLGKWGLRALC